MKKTILILSLFILSAMSAQAYVDSQYTINEQFLVNTGYSSEMGNMTKVVSQDPYREPYTEDQSYKGIARRIYHYVVPGQESNLDFYNHSGDYNGWSWKDY